MNEPRGHRIPQWMEPFLHQLKRELGYPIDIGKYGLLLNWINGHFSNEKTIDLSKLYSLCRLLFLQNHEDERKFALIFIHYIVDELSYEQEWVRSQLAELEKRKKSDGTESTTNRETTETIIADERPQPVMPEPPDQDGGTTIQKRRTKFVNIKIPALNGEVETGTNSQSGSRYLLGDNYLPLTRREMVQAWRHLRKQETYVFSNRLDVFATVNQIAREDILIRAVYERDQVNSDDLLLILADRGGSMVPFHKLSDQLIDTAVREGGHKKALVFYFSNYPREVVFKNSNLTDPVSLDELYSTLRPNHTNALIISDAGAARNSRSQKRLDSTFDFLYGEELENDLVKPGLHKCAQFVVWVNPMPRHRWMGNVAGAIASDPDTPMLELMDNAYNNFLQAMDKLMGR